MIPLSPGCSVVYPIWIDIDKLSDDIVGWYKQVGGNVKTDTYWTRRGVKQSDSYVSYGKGKWCHHHQNGEGGTRLHFMGDDANVASMFLLKFAEHVINHNFKEHSERTLHERY